jgi:hypothetical protein
MDDKKREDLAIHTNRVMGMISQPVVKLDTTANIG